jgi:hypothetical protein
LAPSSSPEHPNNSYKIGVCVLQNWCLCPAKLVSVTLRTSSFSHISHRRRAWGWKKRHSRQCADRLGQELSLHSTLACKACKRGQIVTHIPHPGLSRVMLLLVSRARRLSNRALRSTPAPPSEPGRRPYPKYSSSVQSINAS